jgi:hypothetical protein
MNHQEYYLQNRDRIITYNKNYYWSHIEEKRIYNAMYYENNKENIYINRKINEKRRRQMKFIKQDKVITIKFN